VLAHLYFRGTKDTVRPVTDTDRDLFKVDAVFFRVILKRKIFEVKVLDFLLH